MHGGTCREAVDLRRFICAMKIFHLGQLLGPFCRALPIPSDGSLTCSLAIKRRPPTLITRNDNNLMRGGRMALKSILTSPGAN